MLEMVLFWGYVSDGSFDVSLVANCSDSSGPQGTGRQKSVEDIRGAIIRFRLPTYRWVHVST